MKETLQTMTWGTFGVVHLLSLVFAVLLNVGLYFLLKRCPVKIQLAILFVLSLSGIAAIIFNLVSWNSPLEYLPFHLCSLNAMVLPFAVLTRSKVLSNLTLLWSLGAAVALILNYGTAEAMLLDKVFCFYFFPHVFEMSIPILLFKLGLCKLDAKCIGSTVGITFGAYTAIHFINLAINRHCIEKNVLDWAGDVVQVNYMYSITPENPFLALFYNFIPYQFWYMLPALLIAAIYLAAIYGTAALIRRKRATA